MANDTISQIAINGVTYDLLDANTLSALNNLKTSVASKTNTTVKGNAESTYRTGNVNLTPANIGAVAKGGDTMTGNLGINKNAPYLTLNNTGVTLNKTANNSVSANQYPGIKMYGSDDQYISVFETGCGTDGHIEQRMVARNMKTDGTYVVNGLYLGVKKDGTLTVSVSDAAKWRAAIGAQASGNYAASNHNHNSAYAAKTWVNLGSFANLGSKTYDLTNYSEVIYATRLGTDIYSAIVPKAQLDTTTRHLYLTGGKGGGDNAGRQAVLAVTSTKVTGYNFTKDSAAVTSGVTTWVYAR